MTTSTTRHTTPPAAAPAGSPAAAPPGSPGAAPAPTGRRPTSRIVTAATLTLLVAAAGFVAGRATGPAAGTSAVGGSTAAHAGHVVGGLGVSQDGYRLDLLDAPTTAEAAAELAFRILGPDGAPLTGYRRNHERDLHLVVVGRDFAGYQHLHPQRDPAGTWRVGITLPGGGAYRMIADFVPAGADTSLTLGADLLVTGGYTIRPAAPVDEATVLVDGYTVTLDGGLRPGEASQVLVWLGRDGEPVPDLEPYLGSFGHLVALRHGDLGYLHVHPAPATNPSSVVAFAVQVPSAGTYQLFFEFQHGQVVRTAEFSVTAI
ncbi:hypothetical protein [Solwaraspora sp. WMMA2065]|uniref:hypothetical protein n=1 Tax=Solwaraspora sp. WMMA2065 TaxID=3015166 RepID=UPI00259BA187|nr:hypothetical protein [Solwaraspora sp. WMMA2065]WJK36448.1 hypothetical protein O7610_08880 [Solwaraspora sp. WMMA2065]